MTQIGLIVNPIAGLGGSVGLGGTDGIAEEAVSRGAVPRASERTERALAPLQGLRDRVEFLSCGGRMGDGLLRQMGFATVVVCEPGFASTGEDTARAAREMEARGAELIVFAGGDGTARDVCRAVGGRVPALGVPAGVKIHSPVYASTPAAAGALLELFVRGEAAFYREAEVLDIDEEAYRRGVVEVRLYGYLRVPWQRRFLQGRKSPSPVNEQTAQNNIARDILDSMEPDTFYIIGPGTTTRALMERMGLECTLIGVDLVRNRELVANGLGEQELLRLIGDSPAKIVVTPIGGQGYLFGRGNQQLSPAVLGRVGKEGIIVAATQEKLAGLRGAPLLVDTGSNAADDMLRGYIRITVGYREQTIYPLR